MKFFNWLKSPAKKEKNLNTSVSYYLLGGDSIVGTKYDSPKLAIEGYIKNIIVYRCIKIKADQVKRLKYKLYVVDRDGEIQKEIKNHELLTLLNNPYPQMTKTDFLDRATTQREIYGNYYIEKVYNPRGGDYQKKKPVGLFPMRPDWINITEGNNSLNSNYTYQPDIGQSIDFPVSIIGNSNVIHSQMFNPDDDHHGLSPLVPAGYSIDTHNAISKWNFKFMKNSARPSGVLSVPEGISLSDTTFARVKLEVDEKLMNENQRGKPLLLEGGIQFIPMSLNPKDGDFIEMKKQVTHEIALAFGIPLELLNTEQSKYDNLAAAYAQLYNDQIIPIADSMVNDFNNEVVPFYGNNLLLKGDFSHTSAMQQSKLRLMEKINNLRYLTNNEKREYADYEPLEGEDELRVQPFSSSIGVSESNKYIANQLADGSTYEEAQKMANIIYG